MGKTNWSDIERDLDGQKAFWLWLFAAVMSFALLFGVETWVVGAHG